MPIGPGTKLGSYVIEDFIGQGAMGVVYRAYHAQLERTAAVKVLQGLSPDTDTVARFRREAQSIGHMRHPNVLTVFDFGQFEGTPYMIVEYVEGGSLAGRLKQGPVDRSSALRYLKGIGDALDYAHSQGIVHRDVKPANVLLGAHDTPILADFGLAKLLQSTSIKSMTGVTTGTPAYMAPEQVTGSKIGPAADRYSLAVMAYEMLTGSLPFDGSGVLEVLYAHVHREPPAPSSLNPQLGSKADEVVVRGMAKEPEERWASCSDFVAALQTALDASPAPAPVVDSTVVLPPPIPAPAARVAKPVAAAAAATAVMEPAAPPPIAATTAVAMPPPQRKGRRRTLLFAVLAAALVLTLIVGAVVVYGATRPTTIAVLPQIVRPGEHVVVTARHVPRDQTGDIQLGGPARTFAFHADSGGNVSLQITVPREIGAGDYLVKICWNGTCHASTTLRVVAAVAFVTPGASPSPSATPGVSPSPGSTPSVHPTSSPTHSAASSPTPRTSPSPLPPPAAVITLKSPTITLLTGTDVVNGSHFTVGGKLVTITFIQGVTSTALPTASTGSTGTFSKAFTVPATAVIGPATIKACDSTGVCATTPIQVVA